jgi:hypothetical protein
MPSNITRREREIKAEARTFSQLSVLFNDISVRVEKHLPEDAPAMDDLGSLVHEVVDHRDLIHEEATRLWARTLLVALVLEAKGKRLV